MLICSICQRECVSKISLGTHIRQFHKIGVPEYLILTKYNHIHPTCKCGCFKNTKYDKTKMDFRDFVRGHKNDDVKERIKISQKNTFIKKYNVENPFQIKKVIEKIQNARKEKMSEIVKKSQKTLYEKYGVKHHFQVGLIGKNNPFSREEVKEKIKLTNFNLRGVDNPAKDPTVRKKASNTMLSLYGKDHFSKTDAFKKIVSEKKKNTLDHIKILCDAKDYIPLFDYRNYEDCKQILEFKCSLHDVTFKSSLYRIQREINSQCPKCKHKGTSFGEQEIYEFIKQYFPNSVLNDRKTLHPCELDIHIPEKNIAIEYHGLYWHSEQQKEKQAHKNKFLACKGKNIQLLQFFEDEWRDRQNICKSIIKAKLGLLENRLYARKLHIIESTKENKDLFDKCFGENHLQGSCKYIKAFALVDDTGELQQCISLREPFIRKEIKTIEIARSVSKINTSVVGGFQRLLKKCVQWAKENNYTNILTYSDCRYSLGEAYSKAGFKFISHTVPDYFYTDFMNRYNRFKFRAWNGKTEKEIAKENNVYKIYGAGNYRWVLPL